MLSRSFCILFCLLLILCNCKFCQGVCKKRGEELFKQKERLYSFLREILVMCMRMWKALIFTAFDGMEQALVICWNNRRSYILKYTLLRNLQLIYDLSNLRLCILHAQYWEFMLSGKGKEERGFFFPSLLRIISNSILRRSPRWNKNIDNKLTE